MLAVVTLAPSQRPRSGALVIITGPLLIHFKLGMFKESKNEIFNSLLDFYSYGSKKKQKPKWVPKHIMSYEQANNSTIIGQIIGPPGHPGTHCPAHNGFCCKRPIRYGRHCVHNFLIREDIPHLYKKTHPS